MDPPPSTSQHPQPWVAQNVSSLDCGMSYQPLSYNDSIRLLKLYPLSGTATSPTLECTMSERSMAECKGRYIALSYTWGNNPTARREILVNGQPAFITENLYAALTHILSLDSEGWLAGHIRDCELWVDAVCINQQDAAEKFAQVANMGDVFANAKRVVAWMGASADGSDELLQAMYNASGSITTTTATTATTSTTVTTGGQPSMMSPLALQAFLTRDWWNRMWILQEFMIPKIICFLCGHSYTNLYDLFEALAKYLLYLDQASGDIVDAELWDLLTWRTNLLLSRERFLKEKELQLMHLMEVARDTKCTDPRDRIFALLGLMGQDEKRRITCDYRSSPCEVFCNAIRVMAMDADPTRARKAREAVDLWKSSAELGGEKLQEHDPLQLVVPARWACDGTACSSLSLCIRMPEFAKVSGKQIVQHLIRAQNRSKAARSPEIS